MESTNKTRALVKSFLASQGASLASVVREINKRHPDKPTSPQNLTNKLLKETIKLSEVMEIADVLGFEITFKKKN